MAEDALEVGVVEVSQQADDHRDACRVRQRLHRIEPGEEARVERLDALAAGTHDRQLPVAGQRVGVVEA